MYFVCVFLLFSSVVLASMTNNYGTAYCMDQVNVIIDDGDGLSSAWYDGVSTLLDRLGAAQNGFNTDMGVTSGFNVWNMLIDWNIGDNPNEPTSSYDFNDCFHCLDSIVAAGYIAGKCIAGSHDVRGILYYSIYGAIYECGGKDYTQFAQREQWSINSGIFDGPESWSSLKNMIGVVGWPYGSQKRDQIIREPCLYRVCVYDNNSVIEHYGQRINDTVITDYESYSYHGAKWNNTLIIENIHKTKRDGTCPNWGG